MLSPKTETAGRFLEALFAPYRTPGTEALRIEIRPAFPRWAGNPGGPFRTPHGARQWFGLSAAAIGAAARHAARCGATFEVYFGVLPRAGRLGTAASVQTAAWLWADIDGGDDGPTGALMLIRSAPLPPPHLLVVSGGGVHAYWRLSAPVALVDTGLRTRFAGALRRLAATIGGTTPGAHADPAACDLGRILRVPGTWNRKRRDNPTAVRLLRCCAPSEDAWSLLRWCAFLPVERAPTPGLRLTSPPTPLLRGEGSKKYSYSPSPLRGGGWGGEVREGTRHQAGVRLAVAAFRGGMDAVAVARLGERFAARNGFPEDEMARIVAWAERTAGGWR